MDSSGSDTCDGPGARVFVIAQARTPGFVDAEDTHGGVVVAAVGISGFITAADVGAGAERFFTKAATEHHCRCGGRQPQYGAEGHGNVAAPGSASPSRFRTAEKPGEAFPGSAVPPRRGRRPDSQHN